jgi:hypothetical protein
MWLLTAARVLHWFNPLVWLAARSARTDAELACDETVLRHSAEEARVPYGETLLLLMQQLTWRRSTLLIAGILEDRAAMRARVANIGSYAAPSRRRVHCAALLLLAVGAVFASDEKSASSAGPPVTAPLVEDEAPVDKAGTPAALGTENKQPVAADQTAAEQAPPMQIEVEAQFIETTDTALLRLKPGGVGVSVLRKMISLQGKEMILSADQAASFGRRATA